jgi:hypothetical protein
MQVSNCLLLPEGDNMASRTIGWIVDFADKMYAASGPDALGIAQRQLVTATDDKARTTWKIIVEHLELILRE